MKRKGRTSQRTATTPQPAGRSIANSAAIWRRGIIVRLFECSDCPIGASGAEEVVEGHLGLDRVRIGVADETEGRHIGDMNGLARSRLAPECRLLVANGQVVHLLEFVKGLEPVLQRRTLHMSALNQQTAKPVVNSQPNKMLTSDYIYKF